MILEHFNTKYIRDAKVRIEKHSYPNKNLALALVDAIDDAPLATITVNPPDEKGGSVRLSFGEVAIKDWGENEGMVRALIEAGIIEEKIVRVYHSGYVGICVYHLTEKAKAELGL